MCKLKKKPNQQLEPSARPSSGRGNAQMRRITRDILRRTGTLNRHTSTILAQLVEWTFIAGKQRTSGPSQRKAPKKISPARLKRLLQNNTRPSCQACMDRRGAFDLLIGSVAKDGETLAKCASIFIEHGFPLMPVATPARMPTPLHAAAARGLHKLLERAAGHGRRRGIASEIRTEHQRLGRRSCPHGDRHGAGYGRGRQHVSMNKSVAKAPKSVKPANCAVA